MGHVHQVGPPPFKLDAKDLGEIRRETEHYRSENHGLLPTTGTLGKDWRYLESRYSVDPSRFTHFHPVIGRWIAENYRLTHEPVIPVVPPCEHHTVVVPPGPVLPLAPASVPEPSSALLVCVGLFILVVVAHFIAGKDK